MKRFSGLSKEDIVVRTLYFGELSKRVFIWGDYSLFPSFRKKNREADFSCIPCWNYKELGSDAKGLPPVGGRIAPVGIMFVEPLFGGLFRLVGDLVFLTVVRGQLQRLG